MAAPPFSPDDMQRKVLEHTGGPLLVTGAAGTGKTTLLRERFAGLLEGGADPERTVLVVGSIRARNDARAFLLDRLSASLPGLQVLTVHGLAHRVLKERFATLGYAEPPEVLSAAEQFAKVRELLDGQDPAEWPAYGHLLRLRGFADEVRGFLLRAQEELRTPAWIEDTARERGLTGWHELARFLREYQEVLDHLNAVDFAALVQRAALALVGGVAPTVDHVLVDDFQDTTLGAEALLRGLAAHDVVVAANPDAHVFSFQGTTRAPLERFGIESFPGAATVELVTAHRPAIASTVDAWVAPHTSEEHATIARELRRLHVDEETPWSQLAVVVRRQGPQVAGLLRALDDAAVPRAVPERGLSLVSQPATIPYVLALRWLIADAPARDELIESLLTSDVVGLSPAAARGLIRLAKSTGPAPRAAGNALDRTEGLAPEEAAAVEAARATLTKAALFAGMSVQDAFKVLWEELPCSARLVAEGGPELDVVVTFANVISDASEQGDASVQAFLEALDAGEHGPGWAAREAGGDDAVQVLTAHGAAGLEFDTVIVSGATEGSFPSLTRPEPMFDLSVLTRVRSRSEHLRERLQDERRLFRLVLGRARRRALLVATDPDLDASELARRSRFVDELDGVTWRPVPGTAADEPVSVREAAIVWRRELADPGIEAWRRLAALDGLHALGVDPARWWFTRDWTDTGRPLHETLRLSYSRLSTLDNCELEHVLGDELGLGRSAGYQAWVGKLVHGIIEDIETGSVGKTKDEILAEVDLRWREQEFPSKAVAHAYRTLVETRMMPNWWRGYGEGESLANERFFEFGFEGVTIVGVIDRIGALAGGGTRITDFKTGNPDNGPKAEESLQLGIYYLAVQECEDLAGFRPVRAVELSYLKGHWKDPHELVTKTWMVSEKRAEPYQEAVRGELARLVAKKRELLSSEVSRPNPAADCHWCEFRSLCPLWPEGQPLFDPETSR